MRRCWHLAVSALVAAQSAHTLDIDLTDPSDLTSVKTAASTIAHGMMQLYTGNQTGMVPGLLPSPYYWWECGAMLNSLINYWYYTGDPTYNQLVVDGMQFQVGPDNDYMVCWFPPRDHQV